MANNGRKIENPLTPLLYRSHENGFSRKCELSCNESIAHKSQQEGRGSDGALGRRMALWEVKLGMHVDTIAMLKNASDSHHGSHAISQQQATHVLAHRKWWNRLTHSALLTL